MEGELGDLKYSKSTLHIDIGQEMPVALIKKIIRTRVKENEARVIRRLAKDKS